MELITPLNAANGYMPYIDLYTRIYGLLNSYDRGNPNINNYTISANSITCHEINLYSISSQNLWVYSNSYSNVIVLSGNGGTYFGLDSITGNYNVYYSNLHKDIHWATSAATNSFDSSTYNRKIKYFNWSYYIQDAASAAVSGCFAYPSDDGQNWLGSQYPISAYPDSMYFVVSANSWNIDIENSLNLSECVLVTSVNGTQYINPYTSSEAGKDNYFWAVSLRDSQYAAGNTVYWWLQLSETWTGKITKSATGSFKIDTTDIDNSISANIYGGGIGTSPITGARSCLTRSMGQSSNWKWIEICGVDWA